MAVKILIVEDDNNIADLLRLYLEKENYEVAIASDGGKGVELFRRFQPDLVLLDLMLPVMDGWGVCRTIRSESQTPVIMLTAKSELDDKVAGLKQGADDYITKPFDPAEVVARVRSQLRRYTKLGAQPEPEKSKSWSVGPITLEEEGKRVTVDGEPVALTPIEFSILRLLISHPGRVYSSAQIYEQVWQEEAYGAENAVSVHIRHLRQKLELDPSEPRWLKVVWGLGYKMEGERQR